jgi:predicted GIY-YIG superfamily endonuclease
MIKIKSIKNKSEISASRLPKMSVLLVAPNRKEWLGGKKSFIGTLLKSFYSAGKCFCVYVLWKGEEIIYIGKSVYPAARLQEHRRKINYTHASMLSFEKEELMTKAEILLIKKHKPVLNKQYNSNNSRKTKKQCQ